MNYQAIYQEANDAGLAAGVACVPHPMIVSQHANMMDDKSAVTKQWYVSSGVCGFAWIVVRPGNCGFAKWLKANGKAHTHHAGGVAVWVSEFGQSMEQKEAYARAFAKVVEKHGIKACADSRMD